MRLLLITLIIFVVGCASTSVTNIASQDNEDVLILTLLIQNHLRKTDGRDINLTDLIKKDNLSRISNSFKTLTQELKGHISVYYKFSESRNSKGIELSDKEKELTKNLRWTEKRLKNQYDGEIQIDYGERFYRLIRIIKNKTD
jgi:hypothetical protein